MKGRRCSLGAGGSSPSPLGHWTFDETSGTAVADSTDNENDGTGTSLSRDNLNPVGDRGGVFEQSTPTTVDIGAVDLFKLSEFTYAAWIKPDSDYTNVTPFSTAAVTSGGAWNTSWVVADDGAGALKLNLDYGNGSTRNNYDSPDGVVPYDTWSHVAVTFDGSTIKMYVDGSEVHSVSGHGAVSYDSTYYKVAIGARMFATGLSTSSPSRGAIDDVRVYGEVLTTAQIAALYAAGNKVPTMTAPSISGTEEVGETLTANLGTYSDADGDSAGTHTYQWYRADDDSGTNEAAIGGATSSTYTLVSADDGKYLRVGVVPVAATGASPGAEVFSGYTGAIVTPATVIVQKHSEINQSEYSITSTIAIDDSVPLVSEGDEIFSKSFTPTAADSDIVFRVYPSFDGSTGLNAVVAIFEDSTAVGGGYREVLSLSRNANGVYVGKVSAGSTSARTYSVRIGTTTGTLYLNDDAQAGVGLGGVEGTLFEIEEHNAGTDVVRQDHMELSASQYTVSTRLPTDDSVPAVSEGEEVFSKAWTPTASDSIILVKARVNFDFPGTIPAAAAVFKGSTCVGGNYVVGGNTKPDQCVVFYREVAGSTSARTYSVRVGPGNASQTIYANDFKTASQGLNGNMHMSLEIEEVAP